MDRKLIKDICAGSSREDSVVVYRSWFECLLVQGRKNFTAAIIALFLYSFYGTKIEDMEMPEAVKAIVLTFVPVIDANRRNRANGVKGASFGKMGGRPPHNPRGDKPHNPNGVSTSYLNDNVTAKDNEIGSVSVEKTHTDYQPFISFFFFKNLRYPEKQAEKFVNFYARTDWILPGGDYVSLEHRLALAKNWTILDDTTDRFRSEDLEMWHKLYNVAPQAIRPFMIDRSIKFTKRDKAIIRCPGQVQAWIEDNLGQTAPIIRSWAGELPITYVIPEGPKE